MNIKRLPLFSKLNIPAKRRSKILLTLIIGCVYAVICSIIIIPQIDHQQWFPHQLGTTDLPPSIYFTRHKKSLLTTRDATLTDTQRIQLADTLTNRIAAAGIQESAFSLSGEDIELLVPASTADTILYQITAQGTLTFLRPKPDIDFEADPAQMFNQENFEETSLDRSDILTARISNQVEQYSYYELRIPSEKQQSWLDIASASPSGIVGILIDGTLQQGWLIQPDTAANSHLTLALITQSPYAEIVLSYLNDGPLPVEAIQPAITSADGTYSDQTLDQLYALLAVTTLLSLAIRHLTLREPFPKTAAVGLIILGAIAVMKFSSIPVSITMLLSIFMTTTAILFIPTPAQILLLSVTLLSSIPLRAAASSDLLTVSRTLFVFALYGIISVFFYQFTRFYEE